MTKEYRVFVKGFESGQGTYVLAKSKKIAIQSVINSGMRRGPFDARLWKIGKKLNLKLTPYAIKKMEL